MSASVQPAPAQRSNAEPSMEEILASIRRIIAEDQKALDAKAETPAGAALTETAPAASDDVDEDEDEAFDLASIAPPRVAKSIAVAESSVSTDSARSTNVNVDSGPNHAPAPRHASGKKWKRPSTYQPESPPGAPAVTSAASRSRSPNAASARANSVSFRCQSR